MGASSACSRGFPNPLSWCNFAPHCNKPQVFHLIAFLFSSFDPSAGDSLVVGTLVLSLFGFLSYWWAHYSPAIQAKVEAKWAGDRGKVIRVVALKVWGFATMGVIPAWVLHAKWGWTLEDMGVAWPRGVTADVWAVWTALMVSTVVLSMVAGKEESNEMEHLWFVAMRREITPRQGIWEPPKACGTCPHEKRTDRGVHWHGFHGLPGM